MANEQWTLLPNKGIVKNEIELLFGQTREEVRKKLDAESLTLAKNNFPDEDDFFSADKSTHIRVRYADELVQDIEFLSGSLFYQDIQLHHNTTRSQIQEKLAEHELYFEEPIWLSDGQECEALGINIATSEDVGGDSDKIEWVILSSTFEQD